jgi:outer membrane protein assembly factor BamE (lipoprotein component of BamABCDE complex)
MRVSAFIFAAALPLTMTLSSGCTPVISQRGYLPDPVAEASITIHKDTKTTIQKKLGDPSTRATFGGDAWYYISSVHQNIAFFDARELKRSILAVYFNKSGAVTNLRHYGLKDGHVVAFETRETPTRGREITFLQQLLNATPGVPVGGAGQPGGQRNPGGGQGPGH